MRVQYRGKIARQKASEKFPRIDQDGASERVSDPVQLKPIGARKILLHTLDLDRSQAESVELIKP